MEKFSQEGEFRRTQGRKRRKNTRKKKGEMIEKRMRKGNNNITNTTAEIRGKISKRKRQRKRQINILKEEEGKD